MMWLGFISLTAMAYAAPQVGGGAGQTGEGTLGNTAMLRFGCAQAVIDRIDPYVASALLFGYLKEMKLITYKARRPRQGTLTTCKSGAISSMEFYLKSPKSFLFLRHV